jgi:hypothetical protein
MMVVPLAYYSVRDRLSIQKVMGSFLVAVLASCLAILISLTILSFQIASVEGDLSKGVDHLVFALRKRTYADPSNLPQEYAASLQAETVTVVKTYLVGAYLDANRLLSTSNPFLKRVLRVRYWYLIVVFGTASVLLRLLGRALPDKGKKGHKLALVSATWFSILAPLSWFVIFKSHSYVHPHLNFIVWEMPFTLFGFAICGLALQTVLADGHRLFTLGSRSRST